MATRDSTRRVLLITLNGVSYDLLASLGKSDVMPNVGRLLNSASFARLNPIYPLSEVNATATLQTGVGPGMHGLIDEQYLDHHSRKILPQNAHRSAWPTIAQVVANAWPGAATVKINDSDLANFGWTDRPKNIEQLRERTTQVNLAMEQTFAAAQKIDSAKVWRLLEVQLTSLEHLQYHHRHLFGIDGGPGGNRQWTAETQKALSAIDNCFGQLTELAQRRDASAIIASGYGFVPAREKITLSELLNRQKLLTMTSGASTISYRMSRLKLQAQRSIVGKFSHIDRLGQTVGNIMPIDWHRSRALTFHGKQSALIYLNTPERFGTRLLTTLASQEETAAEVMSTFREAKHPVTHEPLFDDVFLTAERFDCDPLGLFLPEVIATPAPGFHTRHRPDRLGHLLRSTPSLTSTRGGKGLMIAIGQRKNIELSNTSDLSHVTPLVLRLLGIDPPTSLQTNNKPSSAECSKLAQ